MKRELEWIERLEDGVKRIVRIASSKGKIIWQFKRSDQPRWDHVTPPSLEDWTTLEAKLEQLYFRRRASHEELEFVRRQRKNCAAASSP